MSPRCARHGDEPAPGRFSQDERRFLLTWPGIGPRVVERLEESGYASLSAIRACGVGSAVEDVAQRVGNRAWRNRRDRLEQALRAWSSQAPTERADDMTTRLLGPAAL